MEALRPIKLDSELDLISHSRRINEAHRAGDSAALSALKHYRQAGELLNEVKASLPHGDFGPWLEANFEGSERTAQAYMRLAKNWAALSTNPQHVAGLTLRAALAELSEPKEAPSGEASPQSQAEGWRAFIEVSRALCEIRDRQLYRETYPSFEAYVADRFPEPGRAEMVMEIMNDPRSEAAASILARPHEIAPDLHLTQLGITGMPEGLSISQRNELTHLLASLDALYSGSEALP
jgi:hypothetical protein